MADHEPPSFAKELVTVGVGGVQQVAQKTPPDPLLRGSGQGGYLLGVGRDLVSTVGERTHGGGERYEEEEARSDGDTCWSRGCERVAAEDEAHEDAVGCEQDACLLIKRVDPPQLLAEAALRGILVATMSGR